MFFLDQIPPPWPPVQAGAGERGDPEVHPERAAAAGMIEREQGPCHTDKRKDKNVSNFIDHENAPHDTSSIHERPLFRQLGIMPVYGYDTHLFLAGGKKI